MEGGAKQSGSALKLLIFTIRGFLATVYLCANRFLNCGQLSSQFASIRRGCGKLF